MTGNTVIDALTTTVQEDYTHTHLDLNANNRLILLRLLIRENLGENR